MKHPASLPGSNAAAVQGVVTTGNTVDLSKLDDSSDDDDSDED